MIHESSSPFIRVRGLLSAGLAVFLAISPGLAQTGDAGQSAEVPGPGFEEVLGLEGLGGYALSPDGRSVAYEVRSTNWEENRYDREIWLWREGREAIRLTRSPKGTSRAPAWSPDGRWIAFLSNRDEKQQIHLIRADGGEAMTLTSHEEGVNRFGWSPDGARIAFMASEPEDSLSKQIDERYGAFSVEDDYPGRTHLWVVDVDGDSASEPRRLTEGLEFSVTGFDWSPDGTRIGFGHEPEPSISARGDISVLDVASGTVTPVVTGPGSEGGFEWSPDGEWMLYSSAGSDTTSDYYLNSRLWKIPATGGEAIPVAHDLDESLWSYWWTEEGIFVTAWQGTRRPVFRIDPTTGEHREFASEPDRINGLRFSDDGRTVLISGSSPTSLSELYRTTLEDWRPGRITDFSSQIDGWEVGSSEVIRWTSQDGTEIEGVLHKPADFDPTRRHPLLVVIHGGPTGIDTPTPVLGYVYPVNQWLAKGALVLRPNYRGSAGYGEAFRSLNVRNLGVGDAWDVMSGVDHLVAQGIVDTTRMGAMGWSQGGYISAFLTTTTDRFSAISVGAGISDWMTYYVNTDIHPFTRQYLKATPWDDPEVYAKTSPMTYILDAKTPTLIQHGENDRRVPIPNAYQLYQGLQDVGVDTRLIVYEDFGHGISRPKERLAAVWHNWQWFAKYLWGEEVELPLPEDEGDDADEDEGEGS
ncbi:MAG: S9 family peptidase [marine benthic group bacterium]|nr:S9 family peptidase [Gemmatimonadota bacterium]